MNYIIFDGVYRDQLLPFTFTRPVADIRIGILTIREKWELYLQCKTSTQTEVYLSQKYPIVINGLNIMLNASFLPNSELAKQVSQLKVNQAIRLDNDIVAYCTKHPQEPFNPNQFELLECPAALIKIEHTWDIFEKNGAAINEDFIALTQGRKSQPIPKSNNVIAPENIFIEAGASLEFTTLNASTGYIYIGKNAELMEGTLVRGPLAFCEGSGTKLGAKLYGATTIGPYCRVGGEIKNAVLFANSNKGHEGYLGNSVIGEWCNLGADTNNSNLKNNYAEVKLWNYPTQNFVKTGLQFCGLIMGDHSKCAINTMFNTGTVVGVYANIFGSGFQRNFIPSFTWGGNGNTKPYAISDAIDVAKRVLQRRQLELSKIDEAILEHIYKLTLTFKNQ